jgi:rod shape-determining protein MreC
MSRFRFKPWMALVAVLLLLVIAFFSTFFILDGKRHGTAAEGIAGSVAAPAVSATSGFTASIRDFFSRLFALRDVDKKYDQMTIRVQQLELENQAMEELQKENERLMKLFDFKTQYPNYKCMPAKVIGKEPGSWFMNIMLNRGSKDGIAVDMNVVNELGLVGRVVEVGPAWCKVMTVIDRQSNVSAIVELSRDNCIVKGPGDPQVKEPACDLIDLPVDAETVPGDKVVTSDVGNVFMKGILIGTVTKVSRDQLQNSASLTPAVDFAHLEDVLIITKEQPVSTEPPAETTSPDDTVSPDGTASPDNTGEAKN